MRGWSLFALAGLALSVGEARAQNQIRPRVLVMVDTSGSMTEHFQDNTSSGGDGSTFYRDSLMTRSTATDGQLGLYAGYEDSPDANQCGGVRPANEVYDGTKSRMFAAKGAVTNVLDATGNIDWGLMRYSGTQCAVLAHTFTADNGIPVLGTIAEPPGRCTVDGDCLGGHTCDTAAHTCRCGNDNDCQFANPPGNLSCSGTNHCQANIRFGCNPGFNRDNNLCHCTSDAQCGPGVCVNNDYCDCSNGVNEDACTAAIAQSACNANGPRTCHCANGLLPNGAGNCTCTDDTQCGGDFCVGGVCGSYADLSTGACITSANCGAGQTCQGRKCTCATDNDCLDNVSLGFAAAQFCVKPGASATHFCGIDNNHCTYSADFSATDSRNGRTCGNDNTPNWGVAYGGSCGTGGATDSAQCGTKQVCYTNADCKSGNCVIAGGNKIGECACNNAGDCCNVNNPPVSELDCRATNDYLCTANRCVWHLNCQSDGGFIVSDPVNASAGGLTQMLSLVNGKEDLISGDGELRPVGRTPLAGAARTATAWYQAIRDYTNNTGAHPNCLIGAQNDPSPLCDPKIKCRPYVLVQMTDGFDTCENGGGGGDREDIGPSLAASGFVDATIAGSINPNKVYVIGLAFGNTSSPTLDMIAQRGGSTRAALANSQSDIEAALADIVSSSVLVERCNNKDDDCNGACDEPFPDVLVNGAGCTNPHAANTCNNENGGSPGSHCESTGAFVCSADQLSEECSARKCSLGTAATAAFGAANLVTLTGLSGFTAADNGKIISISGATHAGNIGNFVLTFISATSVSYTNPTGVAEAGSISWNIYCNNTETCNGFDDDCNGIIDDCDAFHTPGSCCTSVVCPACNPTGVPQPETCNGCDDDCDTVIDDNLIDTNVDCGTNIGDCSPGKTECCAVNPSGGAPCTTGAVGDRLYCAGGNPGFPKPADLCDGTDDNCDGVANAVAPLPCFIDPVTGAFDPAKAGHGTCLAGTEPCITVPLPSPNPACPPGWPAGRPCPNNTPVYGTCSGAQGPRTEVCNGVDDDCDDIPDNNLNDPRLGVPCCPTGVLSDCTNTGGSTSCKLGTTVCGSNGPVCMGGVAKTPEICDGLDNDCNGAVDDVPGLGAPCSDDTNPSILNRGPCHAAYVCHPMMPGTGPNQLTCEQQVGPMPEVCDGIDNDCDNVVDNPDEVAMNDPTIGQPCDVPVAPADQPPCKAGTNVCENGKVKCEGAVGPVPNSCSNPAPTDCTGNPNVGGNCPDGSFCFQGNCVTACANSEFPCPGGFLCDRTQNPPIGLCVPDACAKLNCPTGTLCQIDSNGMASCTDPCTQITCPDQTRCSGGVCVDNSCKTNGCPDGQICQGMTCVSDPCLTMACPSGQFCTGGQCVPVCPQTCMKGELCQNGMCVPDPCATVTCGTGLVCVSTGGVGSCVAATCGDGECGAMVCCGGACMNDPCNMLHCPKGSACQLSSGCNASCYSTGGTDFVVGAGGGGFTCEMGGRQAGGTPLIPLLLLGLAFVWRRRRVRAEVRQ